MGDWSFCFASTLEHSFFSKTEETADQSAGSSTHKPYSWYIDLILILELVSDISISKSYYLQKVK